MAALDVVRRAPLAARARLDRRGGRGGRRRCCSRLGGRRRRRRARCSTRPHARWRRSRTLGPVAARDRLRGDPRGRGDCGRPPLPSRRRCPRRRRDRDAGRRSGGGGARRNRDRPRARRRRYERARAGTGDRRRLARPAGADCVRRSRHRRAPARACTRPTRAAGPRRARTDSARCTVAGPEPRACSRRRRVSRRQPGARAVRRGVPRDARPRAAGPGVVRRTDGRCRSREPDATGARPPGRTAWPIQCDRAGNACVRRAPRFGERSPTAGDAVSRCPRDPCRRAAEPALAERRRVALAADAGATDPAQRRGRIARRRDSGGWADADTPRPHSR